jgi:hypothetical protein
MTTGSKHFKVECCSQFFLKEVFFMVRKFALFIIIEALLLGAISPVYAMKEGYIEEKISSNCSPKIDVREIVLSIPLPKNPNRTVLYLEGWDDEHISSTILYTKLPKQDPSVKDYINMIDDHIIFGKKNEFALLYDKKKDETVFYSKINDYPDRDIIKIMPASEEYMYAVFKNGQKVKISCAGNYSLISDNKASFKEVENLLLSQQMEKLNHLWTPLNKEKNRFYAEFKGKIYLSQIIDESLYLFSPRPHKTFSGRFRPLSYTPITSKSLHQEKENEWSFKFNFYKEERIKGEGIWIFASQNQILTFWEKLLDECVLYTLGDLKDVNLKIEESLPRKDKSSDFFLYGDNTSDVIKKTKTLNDKSIDELEKIMYPNSVDRIHGSVSGFLGSNDKLLDVLIKDNDYVRNELGLSHRKLAEPLKIINHALDKWILPGTPFLFHGNIYMLHETVTHGFQCSPFFDDDSPYCSRALVVYNLSAGELLSFSTLAPYLIEKYGFYEGNVPYRVDPKNIVSVFPWLSSKK